MTTEKEAFEATWNEIREKNAFLCDYISTEKDAAWTAWQYQQSRIDELEGWLYTCANGLAS
jgi:hypothetical protein